MVKTALEDDGYEVVMATSGEKTIKRAEITDPDLILLDVLMPGIDGFETCRRLKANQNTREIPVMFMTALADIESIVTGFKVGGVDYVTKPIEIEEVLVRTRNHTSFHMMKKQLELQNQRMQKEINERKQAERALKESEELHRVTLGNISDAVFITDDDGSLTFICPNVNVIFGFSLEEVKALGNISRLIGENLFDLDRVKDEGELTNIETEIRDKSGRKHVLLVNVKLVSIQDGTLLYSCRDITQRKEVEDALQRAYEEMEERVDQRTNELRLANEQLKLEIEERKHAEDEISKLNFELEQRVLERTAELEAVNRDLEDFAYIVSHDLKAPIRSIIQLTGWLAKDYTTDIDEEGHKILGLLISRTKRMNSLINGVLEYSRVGRFKGKIETVDLNVLVDQVIEMLAAPPDNISVTLDTRLPVIEAEKVRIEQVFQNLIGNAVKFMDKEQGEVKIRCVEEGDDWKFSVEDNGPGIEKKYYDQIFQIFQTLLSRDVMENTGVGLTIVKKIIELYGGKIWVESELGKGSTFFFTIPK
jgi:PAS domain S-box-containing protein